MNLRAPLGAMRRAEAAGLLKATPLFAGLRPECHEQILDKARFVELETGEHLFHQGDACGAIFVLASGFLKLQVSSEDGGVKVVEFVEPGDSFAEAAMFSGHGYPVTAVSMVESSVLSVDAMQFRTLLKHTPEASWRICSVLSRRLHQLVGQIRSISLGSAEQRVAHYLLEQADLDEAGGGWVGHLPHRRAELASMLSITTETLSRVLTRFRKQGWIETEDSHIRVSQPEALAGLLSRQGNEKR